MKCIFILHALLWFSHCQVSGIKRTSPHNSIHGLYRKQGQQIADQDMDLFTTPAATPGQQGAAAAANRLSTWATTAKRRRTRTTPSAGSVYHYCDYIMKNCLQVQTTGKLCARTVYYEYRPYDSYCHMEYVNCREGYEIWQVVHMGACFELPLTKEYIHYVYHDDWFLDNYYILEDF